jgi:cytochrome c
MKKIIFAFAICLAFGASVAFAGPGADLYKRKCAGCHGRDGAKTSGASGGTMLKGQSVDTIKSKLMGYKDESYGGKKKRTMIRVTGKLDKKQIRQLSRHIGGL